MNDISATPHEPGDPPAPASGSRILLFIVLVLVAAGAMFGVLNSPSRRLKRASDQFDSVVHQRLPLSAATAAFHTFGFNTGVGTHAATGRGELTGYLRKALPQRAWDEFLTLLNLNHAPTPIVGRIHFLHGNYDTSENWLSAEKLTSATLP